jgi:integrase
MKAKNNRFNFKNSSLKSLPTPQKGKRSYYYDEAVKSLGISITDKDSKTFFVYRKIEGRPERIILGRFPDLSVENARKLAFETNALIAQGKNPNREKNKLKKELTLNELFLQYFERHAKLHKKSWKTDEKLYRLYLARWDRRRLSSIHRSEIESLHAKVGKEHGIYAANRMITLLGVMFNKAIDWGWEGTNSAVGIKKFREISRERFLAGDELPRFFEALKEEHNRTLADFFMLGILTGARRGNLLSMTWQDINLDQATWCIPETKNGSSLLVPLSPEATVILKERLKEKQNNWVFPSSTSRSGHLEEPKSAWKRILKRAKLQNLRIHDLRRTLGSWQAATGANSYVIGKSLGHKSQQATAIYARLNIDPVRESVERATSAMIDYIRK